MSGKVYTKSPTNADIDSYLKATVRMIKIRGNKLNNRKNVEKDIDNLIMLLWKKISNTGGDNR